MRAEGQLKLVGSWAKITIYCKQDIALWQGARKVTKHSLSINHPNHPHYFHFRLLRSFGIGLAAIVVALGVGTCGYHYFESMSWVDAFANASMILSGMGPLHHLNTTGGKIFAGLYALFSGLFFILIIAIIFSPYIHRFFTKIHAQSK